MELHVARHKFASIVDHLPSGIAGRLLDPIASRQRGRTPPDAEGAAPSHNRSTDAVGRRPRKQISLLIAAPLVVAIAAVACGSESAADTSPSPTASPVATSLTGAPIPAVAPISEGAITPAELSTLSEAPAGRPPLEFPLAHWAVTDRFGAPRAGGLVHGGIDLAVEEGEHAEIRAACSGIVRSVETSPSLGLHVIIDCGAGWATLYAHLSAATVVVDDLALIGKPLGITGSSGFSSGEHLHFEVLFQGTRVNPEHVLDFAIPPGTPLTYDQPPGTGPRETPTPAVDEATAVPTATPTPTRTPTPTATPTVTRTPTPTPTPTTRPPPATPTPKPILR